MIVARPAARRSRRLREASPNVLVIDVGGSNVKMLATGQPEKRSFRSGKWLTPGRMVRRVLEVTRDWDYDVVSLGYPGLVGAGGPRRETENLADGWVGFDFAAALGKPVQVLNDAAMQALGSYQGGRMLFLGLGTGVGSALISERAVIPLELGDLPYRRGRLVDFLGKEGRRRLGRARWQGVIEHAVPMLRAALVADYVVLGGGQAARVDPLPEHVRRGTNANAFAGGFRLWEHEVAHIRHVAPAHVWKLVP